LITHNNSKTMKIVVLEKKWLCLVFNIPLLLFLLKFQLLFSIFMPRENHKPSCQVIYAIHMECWSAGG
jgi:hypothetical protein